MSTNPYDDILKLAERLSPEEQRKLAAELSRRSAAKTGGSTEVKSLFRALNERGLIGSLTDAPADLATNPEHMEGFGRDGD